MTPTIRTGGEGGWLPIETAPRDGSLVLLWTSTRNDADTPYIESVCEGDHIDMCQIGYWEEAIWAPMRKEGAGWRTHIIGHATHWRPLPPAPGAA